MKFIILLDIASSFLLDYYLFFGLCHRKVIITGFRHSVDFILVLRKLWPVDLTRHFRQEDQNQPAKGRVYILAFSQSSHIQFYNKDITHDQPYYPNVINIHIYKLIKSQKY